MSDERAEIILDRPIIRPQGRIRVQCQQGGLFTDGDRFNYPNWFGNATDDYDELLFILNGKPFLYHRAKRPRLVQENAPGDSPQYFDLDSTIRHLSNSEAVRWFDRQGRDVPADPAFTAAVKPATDSGGTELATVKPVLHPDDLKILRGLARSPATMNQYDLESATRLSRKTISDRLKSLRDAGLVYRPKGERGGEAITDAGRAALPADDPQPAH